MRTIRVFGVSLVVIIAGLALWDLLLAPTLAKRQATNAAPGVAYAAARLEFVELNKRPNDAVSAAARACAQKQANADNVTLTVFTIDQNQFVHVTVNKKARTVVWQLLNRPKSYNRDAGRGAADIAPEEQRGVRAVSVKVVTDSACDLPQALVDELGISIVPLTIRIGAKEYVDRIDLTPVEFWQRCKESPSLPETAAPSPGAFEEVFRSAAAAGHDGVVCINLSGGLSATLQAAQLAASSAADAISVRVVDSRHVSISLGLMVLSAARLAQAGKSIEDVAGSAEDEASRTKLYATFDTLDNLKKGGRIGGAQAFFGTMLSIKPVIELREGVVEAESRQRTRSKSLRYLADKVAEHGKVENLAVLQAECPDLQEFLDMLAAHYPRDEIIVSDVGAVIGAHAGPRAMGVSFQLPPS